LSEALLLSPIPTLEVSYLIGAVSPVYRLSAKKFTIFKKLLSGRASAGAYQKDFDFSP